MSKSTITRLFIAAVLGLVLGLVVVFAALMAALANGAVTVGGPTPVVVNGAAFAGSVAWLVIGGVAIAAGAVAALASWIGALLNTIQLEDKTWFIALLVLGLFSLGWLAMAAYVLAGPDATRQIQSRTGMATAPGS
jgi:hypothetical protein